MSTMLSSRSLSVLLNRATKPLHLHSHHGSLPLTNKEELPEQNVSKTEHQQGAFRSFGTFYVPTICDTPQGKIAYSVIVADCGGCDCSAFILKLLESSGRSIKIDRQASVISFHTENVAKHITLIEVNFEKHDLWASLSFDGCILLYSPNSLQSYRYALQKLSQLKSRREKCVLWLIGIISDPASSFMEPRIISREQAAAEAMKMNGHYWEVIPDGKSVRSPLVYNQIAMELVSLIGNLQINVPEPNKITFEFSTNAEVMRKKSRSCEFVAFS